MNNKKFDINKHLYFGFQTYDEYYQQYGFKNLEALEELESIEDVIEIQKKVEYEILENAKKYIDMMLNKGFNFIFDDIQEVLDIKNRNTIQTKFIKNMNTMYITKPCRDLICGCVYNLDLYFNNYRINTGAHIYYESKEYKICKDKTDLLDVYKLTDLKEYGITREKFRKKLFFTYSDLHKQIHENFLKEVKLNDGEIDFVELTDRDIKYIILTKLKSEKTIREHYKLTNLTQLKRRMEKKEGDKERIGVNFKVKMKNETNTNELVRYSLELSKQEEIEIFLS